MSDDGDLAAVQEEFDEVGEPVTYRCEYLTKVGNTFRSVIIPAYFDLAYPCNTSRMAASKFVSSALLSAAATRYRILPSGDACWIPPDGANDLWLVEVSSLPQDGFVSEFGCQSLIVDNVEECCVVVGSNMTFTPQGGFDTYKMMVFVAQQLDSTELTENVSYRTSFIGSEIESKPGGGKDSFPPVVNIETAPQQTHRGGAFTAVGGVILGGIIAAILGIIFALFRKRRRQEKNIDIDIALSKSEHQQQQHHDTSSDNDDVCHVDDDEPTFDVAVLKDFQAPEMKQSNLTDSFDAQEESSYPESSSKYQRSSYTFDLGQSFKNEIMGAYGDGKASSVSQQQLRYGPTTMEVVPPYPMSVEGGEASDNSEVDSWAQTDGTVGSLEERLEEITVEI